MMVKRHGEPWFFPELELELEPELEPEDPPIRAAAIFDPATGGEYIVHTDEPRLLPGERRLSTGVAAPLTGSARADLKLPCGRTALRGTDLDSHAERCSSCWQARRSGELRRLARRRA